MNKPPSKSIGKYVGGALYIHKSSIHTLSGNFKAVYDQALLHTTDLIWNVVKINKNGVSFLEYEDFELVAFPALITSTTINLSNQTVKTISYASRTNPPILHRKELLVSPTDPLRPSYIAITRLAEERGLFANPSKIGTKLAWFQLLDKADLQVKGNRLVDKNIEHIDVIRHRTAIARRDLSQPIQLMVGSGIITKNTSIFDYGCGQGDDVSILRDNGYDVSGWDPHHAQTGERRHSDIVNLGFVLNVIEDKHERDETLKTAWSYARQAMTVSVMTSCRTNILNLTPYRDGHVTSRGTFQKYFSQQELREYLHSVIGEEPVPLSSGIFSIFKDKDLEQDVLLRRRSRQISTVHINIPARERTVKSQESPDVCLLIQDELEAVWNEMLSKGRILDVSEIPATVIDNLRRKRVSANRAIALCQAPLFDPTELSKCAAYRKEDLLVHFALGILPGAPRYAHLSKSIQRDVRHFFGNHNAALVEAKSLLFSSGNISVISDNIRYCLDNGLGAMRDENTFRFSVTILDRLPSVLRILVGCAATVRGGTDGVDFIDIKTSQKRVSFITCYDSIAKFPLISEVSTVDLTKVKSRVDRPKGKVLYLKGKFMPADDPLRPEQLILDSKLQAAGIVNESAEGPIWAELKKLLTSNIPQSTS